jgi:DNA modification methylase
MSEDRKVRLAHALTAGDCIHYGDSGLANSLEAALRQSGEFSCATHGWHSYPAGMHPLAARTLLGLGEGMVLDPFCGGGTVLVEALLAGRSALGLDIAPVACLVARARSTLTSPEERAQFLEKARSISKSRLQASFPSMEAQRFLEGWYDPQTLQELGQLYSGLENDPLLKAVFSSILVKTSFRESDTSNHKVQKPPRAPGATLSLFRQKAEELALKLEELEKNIPGPEARARVFRKDAREFRQKEREFGMVLTSPPYPGVYDYLPLQQLRACWLGLEEDGPELGSRRSFKKKGRGAAIADWEADSLKWLKACCKVLKPKGRIVLLLGDGFAAGRMVDAMPAVHKAAKELGISFLARVALDRHDSGLNITRVEHGAVLECP